MPAGGALDFNRGEDERIDRYDLDEIAGRLAACAEIWVPQLYPNGRVSDDELRLANIKGDAPRKTGSCVIGLRGEFAGCWKEFSPNGSGESGGGPLSTLKHATGLSGAELIAKAVELGGRGATNSTAHSAHPRSRGNGKHSNAKRDYKQDIAYILSKSGPIAGTPVETYLASRKLSTPSTPDLLFNEDVTDWKTKTGYPAMIAVVRNAAGEPTGGIHRTLLARDGAAKAEVAKPKKMMGTVDGGAVRLAPMGEDGRLGVSEGIETGIAAMMLFHVPVWAALSTSGLAAFEFPADLKHLFIFADGGNAGFDAAQALKMRAEKADIQVTIALPGSGDDFNADIIQGIQPGIPAPSVAVIEQEVTSLSSRMARLEPNCPPSEITTVVRDAITSGLDPIALSQTLNSIRNRTKISSKSLQLYEAFVRRETGIPAIPDEDRPDWASDCIVSESGEPRPILQNAVVGFSQAPEMQGVMCLDEFANRIMVRRAPPWQPADEEFAERSWKDEDDYQATCWLQRAGIHISSAVVHEAVVVAASEHPYHPVRDYLDLLEWDRTQRLDTWICRHTGADDNLYSRTVGAKWLISAVARVMAPGIKVDHMLILEGRQGIGKSSGLRTLFDPWFADEISELGTKDASINLIGMWLVEFAELDAMSRSEVKRVKAFLTRTTDRFRPPWGRHAIDKARQCVFAGSVNEETYLNDPTGGRRFWPVRCKEVRVEELWRERDQLWAEAFTRFRAGEEFYLKDSDVLVAARAEQAKRQQEDAWDSSIFNYLADHSFAPRDDVTVADILSGLSIPRDRWDSRAQLRVTAYLQKHGWERYNRSAVGMPASWRYRRRVV